VRGRAPGRRAVADGASSCFGVHPPHERRYRPLRDPRLAFSLIPRSVTRNGAQALPGSKVRKDVPSDRGYARPCPWGRHRGEVQPVSCEYGIVEVADGTLTRTCSPHLENTVDSLAPPEAIAVSWMGRVAPRAERMRVLEIFGEELVAAVVHLRTYRLAPLTTSVDSFEPWAFGTTAVTEETVIPDLRLEYWLVPAFQETQCLPTLFASAELSPTIVVNPEEFPLTKA